VSKDLDRIRAEFKKKWVCQATMTDSFNEPLLVFICKSVCMTLKISHFDQDVLVLPPQFHLPKDVNQAKILKEVAKGNLILAYGRRFLAVFGIQGVESEAARTE